MVKAKDYLKNDIDANEHDRLSHFTFRHTLEQRNSACIAVLHFTVITRSSTMPITQTPKLV